MLIAPLNVFKGHLSEPNSSLSKRSLTCISCGWFCESFGKVGMLYWSGLPASTQNSQCALLQKTHRVQNTKMMINSSKYFNVEVNNMIKRYDFCSYWKMSSKEKNYQASAMENIKY